MEKERKEAREIVCSDLRRLAIVFNELVVTQGLRLETPVFIKVWPDGEVFVE